MEFLDPAPATKAFDEGAVRRLTRVACEAHMPERDRHEIALATLAQPQRAALGLDDIGDAFDRTLLQILAGAASREQVDEIHPLETVVVAPGEEIARDKIFEPRFDAARRDDRGEHENAAEEARHLNDLAPIAAPIAQHAGDRDDGEQENARSHEGEAVQHDALRKMELDLPAAVAHQAQREERR